MSAALVADIPEIEESTRLDGYGLAAIKYGEKAFTEEKIFYADSNFFQFFDFKLLEGDAKTALKEPNSIVFTTGLAKKYFGNESNLPHGSLRDADEPRAGSRLQLHRDFLRLRRQCLHQSGKIQSLFRHSCSCNNRQATSCIQFRSSSSWLSFGS